MKTLKSCLAGIMVLALVGTFQAASQAQETTGSMSVSGVVVSSTPTSLVIRTDAGNEMTFVVDTSSQFPAGVAVGNRIEVDYHTLSGGAYHAATVTRLSTPAPVTTTTSSTLPDTAGEGPLLALLSFLLLGAGFGVRSVLRRSPANR
jgi:urease alpha subunit